MSSKLEAKTRELVLECPATLHELAAQTGLNYGWIHNFKRNIGKGKFACVYVETLYTFLSGKELDV